MAPRPPIKTVLVVDDSEVVLELVQKALEPAGYKVITRSKPSGSVAAILREKPDIALLDDSMPTLSGDAIAKILAKVTQTSETIVLLHSSLPLETLRLKSLAAGAHGYIQKTDNLVELVRRIEYWLNKGRPITGKFETTSVVNDTTTALQATASSSQIRAAAPVSSGAMRAASPAGGSSSKIKAAPAWNSAAPPASRTLSSGSFKAASVASSQPSPGTGKGVSPGGKILFIDDDWSMLSTYRTVVAGHLDADFVSSGDDAFNRILSDAPPHLIVCDVVMPGLSGADIYRRAVMLDPRWARRFVFITGAASTPSVAEFLNTLDVRVFHKPIAPERLLDTLKTMTAAPR